MLLQITFTVMTTPEDLRANAEYIRMADEFVEVAGGSNNNNYANVRLIVETAENCAVDAVWAGWGHASENPLLPTSLAQVVLPKHGAHTKPPQHCPAHPASCLPDVSQDCLHWTLGCANACPG